MGRTCKAKNNGDNKPSAMVELKLPVKLSPDHPGRSTNQLKFLFRGVMTDIFKSKVSKPFKGPADPELQLSSHFYVLCGYTTFFQYPINLLIIRERLKNNYYWSSVDCIKDLQRMIGNFLFYNKKDSQVVAKANEFEAYLLSKLINMPTEEVEGLDWKRPTGATKVAVKMTPMENKAATQDIMPSSRPKRNIKRVVPYSPPTTVVSRPIKVEPESSSSSSCSSSSGSESGDCSDSHEKLAKPRRRFKRPKLEVKTKAKTIRKPERKLVKKTPKSRKEEEKEIDKKIRQLKINDLLTVMGIVGTADEIDLGKLEPKMYDEVKRFVTSKHANCKFADSSSCPSSPDICDRQSYGFRATTIVPPKLESSDPEPERRFYDSEDELLLSTY
ncbi:Bromodomain-containing protein 4 [Orchesella cincta]|uniref:Bromodomain-containing protein 4 n=1 Tax=Orchesella cincta TaxID=48709 RepID=A0A1D2N226_ORCCI|nr:Bromodomain-containing protein 4 [Orchesella cincta]